MPKRSPFDDLSTLASASAAAKSARELMRGGLDDATLRAVRESQTLQSALAATQGSFATGSRISPNPHLDTIDAATAKAAGLTRDITQGYRAIDADSVGGTAVSRFLQVDAGIAKAIKGMDEALGIGIPKNSAAEAIGQLHAGSALDTSRLFPESVIPDVVGKALKEMQAASGLGSVADILARDRLGSAYRQFTGPDTISALDYASPMRSVFDELGGAIAPMSSPASAPKALPAPRPRPARPAPDGQGITPAAVAPVSSVPVTIGEIGRRVRSARKAMGMTQQRFADLAGVGRRFLIELEQGKPSLEIGRVLAVCHAAGIKLGFLP